MATKAGWTEIDERERWSYESEPYEATVQRHISPFAGTVSFECSVHKYSEEDGYVDVGAHTYVVGSDLAYAKSIVEERIENDRQQQGGLK